MTRRSAKEPLIKSAVLKGTGFSLKGTGFSLKGTGFSPYVNPAKSTGLQPLRECEIHKATSIRDSLAYRTSDLLRSTARSDSGPAAPQKSMPPTPAFWKMQSAGSSDSMR
jgi:hypothetical protein